ncbi:uncharacterized protein ASCRUDRAFT_69286 [Ascoidea rubescens DSM 1968]|uniref:Hyphally-regulated cell wall protein N-terminal domain-containing protein n=1 Tax=Ascoidea rubescens DSM 1968 TaxID=1344418 RepID=A0A1D2VLK6_9ASCO|nr:hypothetical protein ASCRUDRAFT_69286 [Ascoidea rubescens DSM 1968]ODV62489.1 hypothetical protein ASCRUDRAFT_69286 [Ascoidea rubescens DSM 1968]
MFLRSVLSVLCLSLAKVFADSSDLYIYSDSDSDSLVLGVVNNALVLGSDIDSITVIIKDDGSAAIKNSNAYLAVNSDNQLTLSGSPSSTGFYISDSSLFYNTYGSFYICQLDDYYAIYSDDDGICSDPTSVKLVPKSSSGSTISSYTPDDSFATTITSTAIASTTAIVVPTASDDDDDNSESITTQTLYSTRTVDGSVVPVSTITGGVSTLISSSYVTSTLTTTLLVPVTSTFTSKGKDTLLVVTTYTETVETTSCVTYLETSMIVSTVSTETITRKSCLEGDCLRVKTSTYIAVVDPTSSPLFSSFNTSSSSKSLSKSSTKSSSSIKPSSTYSNSSSSDCSCSFTETELVIVAPSGFSIEFETTDDQFTFTTTSKSTSEGFFATKTTTTGSGFFVDSTDASDSNDSNDSSDSTDSTQSGVFFDIETQSGESGYLFTTLQTSARSTSGALDLDSTTTAQGFVAFEDSALSLSKSSFLYLLVFIPLMLF